MTKVTPDAVIFNCYYQYRFAPVKVRSGRKVRVRVRVLDAGPSENPSFPVDDTIFNTMFQKVSFLLRPGHGWGGSQFLDQQLAGKPGVYPIVPHKFANVGKGALGLFQVGDVTKPTSGDGQ